MCSNDPVTSEATLPGQEPRAVMREHDAGCALRRHTGARCTCPAGDAREILSIRVLAGAAGRTPAEVELP